jgi:hypothetical protein
LVEHVALADGTLMRARRWLPLTALLALFGASPVAAEDTPGCRFICELAWKVEPTLTIENLVNRHRVMGGDGVAERARRERVLETVLALDLSTRVPRLGLTVEASAAPFSRDNEAELEFESNFYWLKEDSTGGWLSSHFDVVDQFSPAARPGARRGYTHKLDFELDTAVRPFARLPEGRWLRGLELETSLDYLATGIPKAGDRFDDGETFLDGASHWSLSFVVVIPVAPF